MSGDRTTAELRNLLAAEFEARGWEYEPVTGQQIVKRAVADGRVDPQALAQQATGAFLNRNNAQRDEVAEAIEAAIGGATPAATEAAPPGVTINNTTYRLEVGQITGSQVNVGGTQINIRADSPKPDVLEAVRALVTAGLEGGWNPDAAQALDEQVQGRDDISLDDVREVAEEIAEERTDDEHRGRAKEMIESIAEKGIGGALGTGIVQALTWLADHPPF